MNIKIKIKHAMKRIAYEQSEKGESIWEVKCFEKEGLQL